VIYRKTQLSIRTLVLLLGVALVVSALVPMLARAANNDSGAIQVQLNFAKAAPRQLEDSTQASITRGYANAWKIMTEALGDNRSDKLDQIFVGTARDVIAEQVAAQQKSGMSVRFIDHGHKLDAIFYSPEGTAIELHDTVEMEQQTMDGGKQIHSDSETRKYVVVFTLVEASWKVRTLQQVQ